MKSKATEGPMGEEATDPIVNKSVAFRAPDEWNQITRRIIACAMEVHSNLGPGLLERLYEDAFDYELKRSGLRFARQHPVVIKYKDIQLSGQRIDLVVENLVVVELKAIEKIPDVHLAQLVSYMRSAKLPLGLLINFDFLHLRQGLYRRLNCDSPAAEPYIVSPRIRRLQTPSSPPSSSL